MTMANGWWLPALYVLWANLHIQFIYGLFTLGVFAAEPWIQQRLRQPVSADDWQVSRNFWKLLGASVLATLLNPYIFGIYGVVWQYATQTKAFDYIIELQALDFRRVKDYVELFLAMAAALALGYRRQFRPSVRHSPCQLHHRGVSRGTRCLVPGDGRSDDPRDRLSDSSAPSLLHSGSRP